MLHQWNLRSTWRQASSLLHLQVCQLMLDRTEEQWLRVFAVARELGGGGGGGCGYGYGKLQKAAERLMTQTPRQCSIFLRSVITA